MHAIAEKLKSYNLKATPQRLAIYKILSETTEHPTVETIYKNLSPQHSTMSLATVYKTVEALEKAGLISSLNIGEGKFRYDANFEQHPHIICTNCHKVDDIFMPELDNLKQKLASASDYDIYTEQLFFFGLCPDCKK